ncbi:SusD/RagB family nutrient-binding outer membrane lipoprotein [Daejeonella lutea]|uniref:Susd and RagB outer membrane lipoprotein n=1 Tax=Daejeonella lutea TaxID=572036 RepID=A0A1T5ABP3_9SPHI|nr:SusD/RagB family nutrient-binding outer membrane lipoprotein [Daejeonella lutea]SKB32356.1 Susd and RagB outer membrane lipoprotein [Daejeonella lutea]
MKKTFLKTIYAAGAIVLTLVAPSCDTEALTDLNKNPNAIETNIPEYSFTALVLNSGPGQNYRALGQGMQYFSSYKEVPATGDKFYNFSGTVGEFNIYTSQWNRVNNLVAMIPGPENVNKRAAAEILRILEFHQSTDQLGDMPYSEAMKGDGNLKPKYDTQQSIYMAMLNELDAAVKSFDATKPNVFGNADPYFKGDVAKWKKFGYTLMLRLGMRMSEKDAANSKLWVEKAVAGGVMTAFADIAYIKYANVTGQMNPRVNGMITGDFAAPGGDNVEGSKWTARFIDHLKTTQDPRLPVISVVWVPSGTTYTANNTPATQRGMKEGAVNTRPSDFDTYSEPSLLYLDRGSPIITMGPAEAYLIIAEAAARGWNVGTTAKAAYDNGVRAAMAQWALWPTVAPHSGAISTAQVDAYLAANPYPTAGTLAQQLEFIATQHWVSMLGDDYEVWSNWRRIKYPVFNYANWTNQAGQKVSYPGNVTAGKMFRRFSYPIAERNVNNTNYLDAIKRQNFSEEAIDLLQGRMWWDVGPGTGQSNVN